MLPVVATPGITGYHRGMFALGYILWRLSIVLFKGIFYTLYLSAVAAVAVVVWIVKLILRPFHSKKRAHR